MADAAFDERRGLLARVHMAKAKAGLDDDTYRDMLEARTGKRSAKLCSAAQLRVVIGHLEHDGFTMPQRTVSGPAKAVVKKVQALWVSGFNLGIINDPSDRAMESFIARQTGLRKAAWLREHAKADAVIGALRAWLAREGGVEWAVQARPGHAAHLNMPGYRVCRAQWGKLLALGAVSLGHTWTGKTRDPDEGLYAYAETVMGNRQFDEWTHGEWAKVSKALGGKLRKGMKDADCQP